MDVGTGQHAIGRSTGQPTSELAVVASAPRFLEDRSAVVVLESAAELQTLALRLASGEHPIAAGATALHLADPQVSRTTARAAAQATGLSVSVAGHAEVYRPPPGSSALRDHPLTWLAVLRALFHSVHADLDAEPRQSGESEAHVLPIAVYRPHTTNDDDPPPAEALPKAVGEEGSSLTEMDWLADQLGLAPGDRPVTGVGDAFPFPIFIRDFPHGPDGEPARAFDPTQTGPHSAPASPGDAIAATSVDPLMLLPPAERVQALRHLVSQARLAQDVYDHSRWIPAGSQGVEGWRDASGDTDELRRYGLQPHDLQAPGSDFRARLYVPDLDGPHANRKPQLVFRGSEPSLAAIQDWTNNLRQGLGLPAPYFVRAIQIARTIEAHHADVELVGHSLGGGLASIAALYSGLPATTFNASGLHGRTLLAATAAVAHDPSRIQAFRMRGDLLTLLQEPDAYYQLTAESRGRITHFLTRILDPLAHEAIGTPRWLMPPEAPPPAAGQAQLSLGRYRVRIPEALGAQFKHLSKTASLHIVLHMMDATIDRLEADLAEAERLAAADDVTSD